MSLLLLLGAEAAAELSRSASLSTTLTISARGEHVHVRSAGLSMTGAIDASGLHVHNRSATLGLTAGITAAGQVVHVLSRSASLATVLGISATPQVESRYTTPADLRDFIIATIAALTPQSDAGVRFRPYRNEGPGDFRAWCATNPRCLRRFQVRHVGAIQSALSGNNVSDGRDVTMTIAVAYPQDGRSGPHGALDRDDTLTRDREAIIGSIGVRSWPRYTSGADPRATVLSTRSTREALTGVDLLVITQTMRIERVIPS